MSGLTAHNERRCGDACDLHDQDLHVWFGLSYASYLTLPRAVLQGMPGRWQRDLVRLLRELGDALGDAGFVDPDPPGGYRVQALDESGRFTTWPIPPYRHAPRDLALLAERWPRAQREANAS